MNKTNLSKAIALCIGAASSSAYAVDVDISSMDFGGIFLAEGQLRDDDDDLGSMQSVDPFFGEPWSAVGIAYFEAGITVPKEDNDVVSDESDITNGTDPLSWGAFTQATSYDAGTAEYTWSGVTEPGVVGPEPFSITFTLAPNHVAWGTLFNWNGSQGIPVLTIMDCTDPANCAGTLNGLIESTPPGPVGPATIMPTGPFGGSNPLFNGGLAPLGCVDSFHFSPAGALEIDIATSLAEACSNPQAAVTLFSYDAVSASGGTVTDDGTTITYTPPFEEFNGPDSFAYTATDGVNQSSAEYLIQVGGELQNNFSMLDTTGLVFGGTNDVDIVWDETTFNSSALDAKGIPTDTTFGIMTIASPESFFNFNWTAHNVRIFKNDTASAITYNFDVTCLKSDYDTGTVDCNRPLGDQGAKQQYMTMTLQPGEIGGHILFDWGKDDPSTPCGVANCNIDVVNLWKENEMWNDFGDTAPKNALWLGAAGVPPATDANWRLVSSDVNGDLINGTPMIDGAFVGSYANFNYKPDKAGAALPPYDGQITAVDIDSFSTNIWMSLAGLFGIFGLRKLTNNKNNY